jgi:Sec-independent protein secretion pathway component TatC
VIPVTFIRRGRTDVYVQVADPTGFTEDVMIALRKLAGLTVEMLVMAVGLLIAAPYFLVLAWPFVAGH